MEFDVTSQDLENRVGQHLKFLIASFHGNATGGGLLYFEVTAQHGKIQVTMLKNFEQ